MLTRELTSSVCFLDVNAPVCVTLSDGKGEERTSGGPAREAERSDLSAEDAAGRPGEIRLPGGELRFAATVGGHGEAEGRRRRPLRGNLRRSSGVVDVDVWVFEGFESLPVSAQVERVLILPGAV